MSRTNRRKLITGESRKVKKLASDYNHNLYYIKPLLEGEDAVKNPSPTRQADADSKIKPSSQSETALSDTFDKILDSAPFLNAELHYHILKNNRQR